MNKCVKQALRERSLRKKLEAVKREKKSALKELFKLRRSVERLDAKVEKARRAYHLAVFGTDFRGTVRKRHFCQRGTE
jgi:predicted RNase H-like nuclease (RuvC/YqgF family)